MSSQNNPNGPGPNPLPPPAPLPTAIASVTPAPSGSCTSLIAPITVTFNKGSAPASVTTSNFMLSGPFGPVPGRVTFNQSTGVATFIPGTDPNQPPFPLGELSTYTVTISGFNGGPYSYSFNPGPCGPPSILPGKATLFDIPNAKFTWLFGNNNTGAMVGFYMDQNNNTFGFISQNGQITNLKGAAFKINDSGGVVGMFALNGNATGYLFQNGAYTIVDDNGAFQSWAYGINNAGVIVGRQNANPSVVSAGFERQPNGTYSPFPAPDATSASNGTFPTDINTNGDVMGQGSNVSPFVSFLFKNGAFTSIRVPQAANGATVEAWGVNDSDTVVGDWVSSENVAGFAFVNGSYFEVAVPGCFNVQAEGVNNAGVVVGICSDQRGDHGFILTP